MIQKHEYKTHILAFGPHPDDVEIGAGGAIYQATQDGKECVIVDLCAAEMSTHGDSVTRMKESKTSAEILGVTQRDNLLLCDTRIEDTPTCREQVAYMIRKWKPEIVLMPCEVDRHPDHEHAAQLIKNGVFYAGLQKLSCDGLEPHKPRLLLSYMIRQESEPDVIIPLSPESFEKKMEAFSAYESQRKTNERGVEYVTARHIVHGHKIGSRYGEGYKLYSHNVGVKDFSALQSGFF